MTIQTIPTDVRTCGRSSLALVALPLVLAIASSGVRAQSASDPVESARAVLDKYVETRRVISKEKRDWAEQQQTLNDRIDLVKQQIDAMRQKIADAEKSIGEAESKKTELAAENDRLKVAAASLNDVITKLEARTKQLLQRVPEPLQDEVRPLSQRLPADPSTTKQSLSERFQNVVGIVNQANKFDGNITMTSEVRTLPDGTNAEVTAVYIGLGQGYYVNARGDVAGIGRATADGWTWTPANDAAPAIAHVIAILKNTEPAAFVRLPIRIQDRGEQR